MKASIVAKTYTRKMQIPLKNFKMPFSAKARAIGLYYDGNILQPTMQFQQTIFQNLEILGEEKIVQIFCHKENYLLICDKGSTFICNQSLYLERTTVQIVTKLVAIVLSCCFDGILLSDATNCYFFGKDREFFVIEAMPTFHCGTYTYDRLFIARENQIIFSKLEEDSLTNMQYSIGGTIDIVDNKGKFIALFPHGEEIVIFREYGIDTLKKLGNAEEFKYLSICQTDKIAKNSIVITNDNRFLFYTKSGLFSYKKNSLQAICAGIENFCQFQEDIPALYANNHYYLQVTTKMHKSCLLSVNIHTESCSIVLKNIQQIVKKDSSFAVMLDGQLYLQSSQGEIHIEKEVYLEIDNPLDENSILDSISILSAGKMQISIQNENKCQKQYIYQNYTRKIKVCLRGKKFFISLKSCAANFSLKEFILYFSGLKER